MLYTKQVMGFGKHVGRENWHISFFSGPTQRTHSWATVCKILKQSDDSRVLFLEHFQLSP